MDLMSAYEISAAVVFSLMASLWLCSLILRDASIVDRFWGAGFVLIAWAVAIVTPKLTHSMALLLGLVTLWGLRLSLYIHLRNQGHGEDYRYVEMRNHHGKNFWWYSFFSVFALQGTLMLIVASPLVYVLSKPRETNISSISWAGALVCLVGFIFEAGGDFQLTRFKQNPENKGKLLSTGLWSITRHPNYFGDTLQWWGFGLFAVADGSLGGIAALVGPLVMTLFIIKVSGVALLEKNLKSNKPGYAEYVARTPAFFPRWPFWALLVLAAIILGMIGGIAST